MSEENTETLDDLSDKAEFAKNFKKERAEDDLYAVI